MSAEHNLLLSQLRAEYGRLALTLKSMELIDGIQDGGSFVAGCWQIRAGVKQVERAIEGIERADAKREQMRRVMGARRIAA